MSKPRVHLVVGTRPEAVKLAPLVVALRKAEMLEPVIVATGQHGAMVDQALGAFGLRADVVLQLARSTGEQAELAGQLAPGLDAVLAQGSDAVVVQGDTTSALLGGLVAMWRRIPVVHLEAGLRSGDLSAPFPEEANRRMLSVFADLHLAPTAKAVCALETDGVPAAKTLLVGNTVVDAVLAVAEAAEATAAESTDTGLDDVYDSVAAGAARLMLVTAHRRESWGAPLDRILAAVRQILEEHPDVRCVLPSHPNPAVRAQVDAALADEKRVVVCNPVPYPELCRLLARSTLVLSDSGGIQEEAPSFRVPVLVLRDVTERTEAVDGGWAELVGTDPARIVSAAKRILSGDEAMPETGNPFGDGKSAERGAQAIAWMLGLSSRPADFDPQTASWDHPDRDGV